MEFFKNIQPGTPVKMEDLISIRDGQIVSMALSKVENAQMVLFALSATESISEEAYWGDTAYYVISGEIVIQKDGARYPLSTGDIIAVPAHTGHAVSATQDAKFLQITLNNA